MYSSPSKLPIFYSSVQSSNFNLVDHNGSPNGFLNPDELNESKTLGLIEMLESSDNQLIGYLEKSETLKPKITHFQSYFAVKNSLISSLKLHNENLKNKYEVKCEENQNLSLSLESLESQKEELETKFVILTERINELNNKLEEVSSMNLQFVESNSNSALYNASSLERENSTMKETICNWEKAFMSLDNNSNVLEEKERENQRLHQEVERLSSIERAMLERQNEKWELMEGGSKLLSLSKEIEELQKTIESLERDNQTLAHQFIQLTERTQRPDVNDPKISKKNEEIRKILDINTKLETNQFELSAKVEFLTSELQSREKEITRLYSTNSHLENVLNSENLKHKLLEDEFKNCGNVLVNSESRIQGLKKENSFMKAELTSKEESLKILQSKQEQLDLDIHNLRHQLNTYSKENDKLRGLYEESLEQIKTFENTIDGHYEESEKREKVTRELKLAADSKSREVADFKGKIRLFEDNISTLTSEIERLNESNATKVKEFTHFVSQVNALQEEKSKLEKLEEKSAARIYYLEQENNIMREKANQSEVRMRELIERLDFSSQTLESSTTKIDFLEEETAQSKHEIGSLKTALKQSIAIAQEKQDLLNSKEIEISELEFSLENEKKRFGKAEESKRQVQLQIENLQESLIENVKSLHNLENQLEEEKRNHNNLQSKLNSEFSNQNQEQEELFEEMKAEMEDAIRDLQARLNDSFGDFNRLSISNQELETYASDLLFDVKRLELENQHLKEKFESK